MKLGLTWLSLLFALAASCASPQGEAADDPPPADAPRLIRDGGGNESLPVRLNEIPGATIVAVKDIALPRTLETTGQVVLDDRRTATIVSRVTGRVEDVYVSQWDRVTRGRPILSLYSPDYLTASAEYAQAEVTARMSADRALSDSGPFATAIVEAARRKLELLGIAPRDVSPGAAPPSTFRMRAPIGGTVVQKQVVKGSQVNPGDVLFTVGELDAVWITADVYEADLSRVHEGLELEAESVAFPDEVFRGSITRVSPTIDPTTHTAQIRCEVKNPGLRLKPQMLMRVRIATDGSTARVVPQEALVFETDGYYAFVQTEQDRLVRRRVGVSSWNERGYARISSGLEPGDLVVQGESIQLNALWHRAMGESS